MFKKINEDQKGQCIKEDKDQCIITFKKTDFQSIITAKMDIMGYKDCF